MKLMTSIITTWAWRTVFAASWQSSNPKCNGSALPVINLGYELHQAASYNETTGLYNFSNIRYGQAPVGDLRFRASIAPENVQAPELELGNVGHICPQADEAWESVAMDIIPLYFAGQTSFNESNYPLPEPESQLPDQDPQISEDCLFLDVLAPQRVLDKTLNGDAVKVPVLVWIHGGGYVAGSKDSEGDPTQLVSTAAKRGSEFIYIAINYRLGAFGWLAGSQMRGSGDMNAGLYDQRLALQWVQSHVSKFGGDPDRVTVMGESAGGGSIISQITAFGGTQGSAPFQQAIIQSPGIFPQPTLATQDNQAQAFLSLLNVTTVEQARRLPSKALQYANYRQIFQATYGTDDYGPVVDGSIVPQMPGELLAAGNFDHSVRILTSYVHNEGLLFTNPFVIDSTEALKHAIIERVPELASRDDQMEYITTVLYPPIFDGSQAYGYTDQIGRLSAIIADLAVVCYTTWIANAKSNETQGIRFSIPPAVHGQDVDYTFYWGPRSPLPPPGTKYSSWIPDATFYPGQAVGWQDIIVGFVTSERVGPDVPIYSADSLILDILPNGTRTVTSDGAGERCKYWQTNVWYS